MSDGLVDMLLSERHYRDHMAPVWTGLGDLGRTGIIHSVGQQADALDARMAALAFRGEGPNRPTLVGGWADHQTARRAGRGTIYVEHGAGQWYAGVDHPSYSGGPEHEGTLLFVCPSETVADRWRARYPEIPAVAVGCPKLDARHLQYEERGRTRDKRRVVAISFHSNAAVCPETAGVWSEWEPYLRDVVEMLHLNRWQVMGHAHPRLWRKASEAWRRAGADWVVEDFDEVLERADVYVADNTSTLPEAASVGIPLVWVWSKHWRDDALHGGRFGDWPEGQVENVDWQEIAYDVGQAWIDPPEVREAREAMVRRVYAHTDGRAAERAVEAILGVLG